MTSQEKQNFLWLPLDNGHFITVELFSDEYKNAAEFRKIPLQALKKLKEPMWLLKIIPIEITCLNSDFKKDGFGSRQIWKRCH